MSRMNLFNCLIRGQAVAVVSSYYYHANLCAVTKPLRTFLRLTYFGIDKRRSEVFFGRNQVEKDRNVISLADR